MYLLYVFFLLPYLARSQHPPCTDFAVNECAKEQDGEISSFNAESQLSCQQSCKITDDCLFYAFHKIPVMDVNCHLFKEPFHVYLDHCDIHSGPPIQNPPSKCFNPDENSCEVAQFEDCVLLGTVLEMNIAASDVTTCEELCRLHKGGRCRYWEWSRERKTCDLYDSTDKVCNIRLGSRDFTPQQCGDTQTMEGRVVIYCRAFTCML